MTKSRSEFEADDELAIALRGESRALLSFIVMLVGDLTVAEDCFQETCLEAWRHRARFDRTKDLGRWLRGIARNMAHRSRAGRSPLSLSEEHESSLATAWTTVESDHRSDERHSALRHCIDQLEDDQRSLVELRYNDHHSHDTIARQLGRTTAAVKMKVSRLRRRLQECVKRRLGSE